MHLGHKHENLEWRVSYKNTRSLSAFSVSDQSLNGGYIFLDNTVTM